MVDGSIDTAGVRLGYVAWGSSPEPTAPPLVLLHGMSSNALFWTRVAEHVRERRIVALDLRGHGRSERPASGYTAAAMADDVAQALEALDLTAPVVAGHSWGAAVGLELAARYPHLTSAFVLIDGPTASLAKRMSFDLADQQMRPPPPCYRALDEAEREQANFLNGAWGSDLRDFVRRSFERASECWRPVLPEPGRLEMVRDLYALQPEAVLRELRVPVLVIAASDDSDGVAPEVLGWWRSQAATAAALCRSGRSARYASRHDIPLIQPALLARDLEMLATRVAAGGP